MNIYSFIIIIRNNKNTFVNLYIRKIRSCFIKAVCGMGILFPCLTMSLRSRHHYQDQILQCVNLYLVTRSTEHER